MLARGAETNPTIAFGDHGAPRFGSYIAAWTAFSVVTLTQLFHNGAWYVWLWPAIVGTPAIVLTTIYYKRKFGPKQRPVAGAAIA